MSVHVFLLKKNKNKKNTKKPNTVNCFIFGKSQQENREVGNHLTYKYKEYI